MGTQATANRTTDLRDPFFWNALIAFLFLLLCMIRLTIPSQEFFDEIHYLPAARNLLASSRPVNLEHPLLGKELIALGMELFGDNPYGWRIMPLLAGVLALFAFQRALWFASLSRFAAIAGGLLLASGFPLFVQSRIAMLDIFMVGFLMIALWLIAAALREPAGARWKLAGAGLALGLAMASKWNAVPLAMVPGLALLAMRVKASGGQFLTARDTPLLPGIALWEAAIWIGLVPLAAYALTFVPAMFYAANPLSPLGLIDYHRTMLALQSQTLEAHPYQSSWPQWVSNMRGIWYLYEQVDGAQRGVLLIGNPLTFLIGLPAMAWCAFAGVFRQRWDCLAIFLLYAVSLGLWLVAAKNVQFFYHYFLPSCFLLAGLALALAELAKSAVTWRRRTAYGAIAASLGLFAFFYPILSAAELPGEQAFLKYAWIEGWR